MALWASTLPGSRAWTLFQALIDSVNERYARVAQIKKFKRQRSFRAWLRAMVDHKVNDFLSQRGKQKQAGTTLLASAPDGGKTPDAIWEEVWNRSHLADCIASLRAEFAEHTLRAFSMYVLDNEPVEEITRRLGVTANQVYVAKHRVLSRIRLRFGNALEALYGASQ